MHELPDPEWYADYVLAERRSDGRTLSFNPVAEWRGWWRVQARLLAERSPYLSARARGFVVLTAELQESGVPRHVRRSLIAAGQWSSPQRGAVALVAPSAHPGIEPLSVWEIDRRRHALRAAAAARCNPGHQIAGSSAAVVHGLPTMSLSARPVLTSASASHRHFRVTASAGRPTGSWYGVPVVPPSDAVVDLARHDRRSGIMAADAALRDDLVTPEQLAAALQRAQCWFGVRQAREIVALADPRGESPLESITRLALQDCGMSAPELQVPIRVPGRSTPYRVDMLWQRSRVILELDGRGKYTEAERWREKRRDRALARLGFHIERFTWDEVVNHWPECAALLRALGV